MNRKNYIKFLCMAFLVLFMQISCVCLAKVQIVTKDELPKRLIPVEWIARTHEENDAKPKYKQDKSVGILKFGLMDFKNYIGRVAKISLQPNDKGMFSLNIGPYEQNSEYDIDMKLLVGKEDIEKFRTGDVVVVYSSVLANPVMGLFTSTFNGFFTDSEKVYIVREGSNVMGIICIVVLIGLIVGGGFYFIRKKGLKPSDIDVNGIKEKAADVVNKVKDKVNVEEMKAKAEEIKTKAGEVKQKAMDKIDEIKEKNK